MINIVWAILVVGGVVTTVASGRPEVATQAALTSGRSAIDFLIGLAAVMVLWMGLNRIAEKAGLMDLLARAITPVLRILFPSLPKNHPALAPIAMNVAVNLLGLGNAATPFGLKAMVELQKLNSTRDTATPAMCTLLALNTSSVTLVPATVIALRAAAGSNDPSGIIVPTLIATSFGAASALILDRFLQWRSRGR